MPRRETPPLPAEFIPPPPGAAIRDLPHALRMIIDFERRGMYRAADNTRRRLRLTISALRGDQVEDARSQMEHRLEIALAIEDIHGSGCLLNLEDAKVRADIESGRIPDTDVDAALRYRNRL